MQHCTAISRSCKTRDQSESTFGGASIQHHIVHKSSLHFSWHVHKNVLHCLPHQARSTMCANHAVVCNVATGHPNQLHPFQQLVTHLYVTRSSTDDKEHVTYVSCCLVAWSRTTGVTLEGLHSRSAYHRQVAGFSFHQTAPQQTEMKTPANVSFQSVSTGSMFTDQSLLACGTRKGTPVH